MKLLNKAARVLGSMTLSMGALLPLTVVAV
jgi:hypothetical protein